jgi:hypothetical protein
MFSLLFLFLIANVNAQVTYEEEMTSNGLSGMMAFKSTSTTYLTETAKNQTTDIEFTGSFMKHVAPKSKSASIVRLDKEMFWDLNIGKKEYTEMTFAEFKKMIQEGMNMEPMPQTQGQEGDEANEAEYEWEKPVVKVIKGEKTQNVNGFKCQDYSIQVTTVGKHKKTGVKDTILVVNDLWNSVVMASAMEKMKNFHQNLAQKLGFDQPSKGMGAIFSSYKDYLEKIAAEAAKLEGYPVKSTMRMTMTSHAQKSLEKKDEKEEKSDVDLSNPVGGLLGGFAKKMAKKQMDKTSTGGAKEVFQFSNELKSIKVGDVAADKFEIPSGFKKVAHPVTKMKQKE